MAKRFMTGAIAVLLAFTLASCSAGGSTSGNQSPTPTSTTATTATATSQSGYTVKVYFSRHPASDNDPSAVFAVTRVSPNLSVATYALQQLFAGPTAAEQAAGYYTPLTESLSGTSSCGSSDFTITLNMRGATPEQGTATVKFCKTTALAGDLTGGRITSEIKATLLQFSTITKVVILSQDGGCFDDMSGQNMCLA